jgi:two-component system, OmpR family, sensor histidine kinase CpxA
LRLVPKIFLWFWVGIAAVGTTLLAVTQVSHSRAREDAQWQERYAPRVDLWARQGTQILDSNGPEALRKYVASFESDPGRRNYLFDADGREVLGQDAPPAVRDVLDAMGTAANAEQRFFRKDRVVAEKMINPAGRSRVVIVSFPQPSLWYAPLGAFLSEDQGRADMMRLAAILAVAGGLCFWLARQITRPIGQLRAATRALAGDQLTTRVDPAILARGDELADLGHDFDRMAERIETLVGAQRRLLSDVSHTLRSPLARLNVALGLARQRANPEVVDHLDRIERETNRLNKLIGQLLMMARVESEIDHGKRRRFDLGTLVEEVAADGDYEARSRRCAVQFRQLQPCTVDGAREMLRIAVENVVRNAVHYTADGTPVEIGLDRIDAGNEPRAVITIRDHGTGVPTEALLDLFTPFHQVTEGVPQQAGSTGLGLAITERTVRVHGGSASAANAPEGGLIVTLELPLSP